MTNPKSTQLKVREDRSTAIAGLAYGANLDAIGFNIAFIALRNPKLAIEILNLYDQAHQIQENDPKAADEDFALFAQAITKLK
jgi:hypothetical protein